MATRGDMVREAREAAGLSKSELARLCGVSPAAVTNWENGHAEPKLSSLDDVARVTGRTVVLELAASEGQPWVLDEVEAGIIRALRNLRAEGPDMYAMISGNITDQLRRWLVSVKQRSRGTERGRDAL